MYMREDGLINYLKKIKKNTLHLPLMSPYNFAVVELRPHLKRTSFLFFDSVFRMSQVHSHIGRSQPHLQRTF